MVIEKVFDENCDVFKKSGRVVLVIGRNSCIDCKAYNLIIQAIHDDASFRGLPIKFGRAILDGQESIDKIRTEHKATGMTCVPYTVLYYGGRQLVSISNIRDNTYIKEQIEKHLGIKS